MHTRNEIEAYPTLQETVIPIDRIVVASANVIDRIGLYQCTKGDNIVYDAEWSDDLGNGFKLDEIRGGKGYESRFRDYQLTVLDRLTNKPKAFYRYGTVRRVEVCNANWRATRTNRSHEDIEATVAIYLEAPIRFSEVENMKFLSIMADNEIHDPRIIPKLRRLGGRAVNILTRQF